MAAPILWAPGIFWFFLLENPMTIKFLLLGGGVGVSWKGGWKCQFYFYGRGDFPFLRLTHQLRSVCSQCVLRARSFCVSCLHRTSVSELPVLGERMWLPKCQFNRTQNPNQGSTPTPWARGLRDQIQKWALQTQKTLYF